MYFYAAAKGGTVRLRTEEPAAYILAVHVDGSFDERPAVIAHHINLTLAPNVRNGWKADISSSRKIQSLEQRGEARVIDDSVKKGVSL